MSRVRAKELFWSASAGADSYAVYGEVNATADFGARADAGTAPLLGETVSTVFPLVGLADGVWTFGIVARDAAGNTADPDVVPNVPLDQSAPAAVTDAAVRFVS
jgi:hypothetical protein